VSEIFSKAQSERAAKLRPKKAATQRSETIRAMRPTRAEGRSFEEFLTASINRCVDIVIITPIGASSLGKYDIECDAPGEPVTRRTLRDWWTEAGNSVAN
jgi:hypothetical protein